MYRPGLTLTVNNAQTVLEAGLRAIADGQSVIDLGELNVVDSAAVATMLSWQRAARKAGKSLAFSNLPSNLQSLVALYDADGLLSVVSRTTAERSDLLHH
ncbi:lipid asymmetry maintenance protein MlaB [Herbaspirillum sp. GCM10030257]|uniref:STAS domain-containing protein n=1 Tax=Herbaspirillum sp. GCM10030257 TaxID=3273393 RepID=UPI0036240DF2